MSLVASYPFTDFSTIQGLATKTQNVAGAANPTGIPGLSIENGLLTAFVAANDASIESGHRSEIYLTADAIGEVWYAWEFMLPKLYWSDHLNGGITIGQLHDSPVKGVPTRQPNFMLQAANGTLYVVWPRATLPTESTTFDRFPAANMEVDKWHSVCVRINWQITTDGFREVFIDRVPVYRQWGVPTAYDDAKQPYFRLGIYNTSGGFTSDKVAYFRNLKRWVGNDGYQAVMGGVPLTRPRLSQV